MSKHTIGQLNTLYSQAESCDSSLFSEMKSNVLLVNSEHYKTVERAVRDRSDLGLSEKQKIRITKNHVQRLTNRFTNGIMNQGGDVKVLPHNESELQDKKAAEMYESVRLFGKRRHKLDEKFEEWCDDYVDIGEVACKIYFDKNKGDIISYHQKVETVEGGSVPMFLDQDGNPTPEAGITDPLTGQLVQQHKAMPDKDRPVYSGDFVFETVLAFNLLRAPQAETMEASPYLIVRKMIDHDDVKAMIDPKDKDFDDKINAIKSSSEETFKVFDTHRGTMEDSNGKVMLKEYYFRPCVKYPRGYYYITTGSKILFEGELPFGVFPIAWRGFKKIQTSPRARSIIKVLRPYQYEINRASSKVVEHHLVHGDDKVITAPGAKMTPGANLPGLRQYHAVGAQQIIQGRTGEQFAPYIDRTIQEMYQVVDEDVDDSGMPQQVDANVLLFRSVERKRKYGRWARDFNAFRKEVYWIYLRLAKHYYDESWVIRAAGRREAVNIAEFKATDELNVQITIENSNEDADALIGKSMQYRDVLQYVGKDLPKEVLGKVLMNMPFVNMDQTFNMFTNTFKNIENDMLALDRGEAVEAQQDDASEIYIKELTARIKSPDFKALNQNIQNNYIQFREKHRQFLAEKEKQIMMAKQEVIPMTGNLVKCDVYTMQDGKQTRLTLPSDAIGWLEDKLNQQGLTQQRLEGLSMGDQIAVSQQMMAAAQAQQQPPMAQPMGIQGGMNGNGNEYPI